MQGINLLYVLPDGRELRNNKGVWEVQPPNDNYWVPGSTPQEALDNAGWRLKLEELAERYMPIV
jgi:hypothetical protein